MGPAPKVWTVEDFRLRSVVDADGCWLWQRSKRRDGYGQINRRHSIHAAHRVVYEVVHGPIPVGLHIDHTCSVRACVNPAHLEAVTQAENNRRGWLRERENGWRRTCPTS